MSSTNRLQLEQREAHRQITVLFFGADGADARPLQPPCPLPHGMAFQYAALPRPTVSTCSWVSSTPPDAWQCAAIRELCATDGARGAASADATAAPLRHGCVLDVNGRNRDSGGPCSHADHNSGEACAAAPAGGCSRRRLSAGGSNHGTEGSDGGQPAEAQPAAGEPSVLVVARRAAVPAALPQDGSSPARNKLPFAII